MRPPNGKMLITLSGRDKPGITAKMTSIIADGGLKVLDMEQVVVQNLLSLSILLELPAPDPKVFPLLEAQARAQGLDADFQTIPAGTVVAPPRSHRYILSLIGHPDVSSRVIAEVTRVLSEQSFNIDKIQRLEQEEIICFEMVISSDGAKEAALLKEALLPISHDHQVDIAIQPDTLFRRVKRLVVFDLDSTLIQAEVIDELAREAGVMEQVAALTHQAMNGQLDFRQSLIQRVALLKGLEVERLERVAQRLAFTPGAEGLIQVLQRLGFKTAVISGGFAFFTERVKARLKLDYAYANVLEVEDGRLTGRVVEPILDGARKAELLEQIARRENVQLDQVVAVGDGANDLPMLGRAGLGIAFNAKPTVAKAAQHAINQSSMGAILFLLGISGADLKALDANSHH